jgi:hypothetical protein
MANRGKIIPAGSVFGMLAVVRKVEGPRRGSFYECSCACGGSTVAYGAHLRNGSRVSCGCVVGGHKNRRHGLSHAPEYRAWENARARCRNPRNHKFPLYGGRGIQMCDRWAESFDAFIADMGRRPGPEYSLDRIDGHKGYEPGNCRWATIVQQNNNRSMNRHIVVDGQRMTVAQAARTTGVNQATLLSRLDRGLSAEEACRG